MARLPTAPVAGGSLIAGFALARASGVRPLGAVPLAIGGGWCTRRWQQRGGMALAGGLLGVYTLAFIGSHPLAKRIGAWPSVLAVSAVSAAAAYAVSDRRAGSADA